MTLYGIILLFMLLIGGVFVMEASLLVTLLLDRIKKRPSTAPWPRAVNAAIHGVSVIVVLCILYGYFIEPYWIEVTRVSLTTEKLHRSALRIVHISDVHCDLKPRNEASLVAIINDLHADLVVFTGDATNEDGALPLFRTTLAQINATIGRFGVAGNWDDEDDLFKDTGFQELNHTVALSKDGERFTVSGMGYDRVGAFLKITKELSHEVFNILLYHTPDLVESLGGAPVDLYLAGHTHGGQVALPFYGALITLSIFGKKYEAGRYQVGKTTLYVNRGIGMEGGYAPRVRFFARPEITVFDITPKK